MTDTDFTTVIYTPGDKVSVVTIDRPDSMNAFNTKLRAELPKAIRLAANDSSRVVVLNANGRGFGAGADLKEGVAESLTQQLNEEYRPIFDEIQACTKPVISAINGAAAGVSLSVALACDLAVMADKAFLLAPFTSIGLIPDGGAHFIIGRQLGSKRAFQILVEAERVGAEAALDYGLVNKIVPADELNDATIAWGESLAERAPLAMKAIKKLLRDAMTQDFDTVFRAEAIEQQVCRLSDDCAEGVAAFLAKRPATFKGS